jgi:hypothetical protein
VRVTLRVSMLTSWMAWSCVPSTRPYQAVHLTPYTQHPAPAANQGPGARPALVLNTIVGCTQDIPCCNLGPLYAHIIWCK